MTGRYDHHSREDLIRLLERRDAQQRYGLVWEREGIEGDRAVNDDFVVLDIDPALSTPPQDSTGWRNLVIEGDNWDALRALRLAYAGRVKCILIDPPYNTGNRDFAYNDRFVGAEDRFRHSTWLEFLYRRLILARDLLADDGVILVCINDENRARLDLLMEQVLPGMRVGSFVWRTRNAGGGTGDRFMSGDHEHVLAYAGPSFQFAGVGRNFAAYRNEDAGGRWQAISLSKGQTRFERPNSYYPLQDPQTNIWYPCNPNRVWAYTRRIHLRGTRAGNVAIEDMIGNGRVMFPSKERSHVWQTIDDLCASIRAGDVPKAGNGSLLLRSDLPIEALEFFVGKPVGWGTPRYKLYAHEVQGSAQAISSLIPSQNGSDSTLLRGGTNTEGTRTLRQILPEAEFSYPKPESLVRALVSQSTQDDSVVLDFFAGSGTTAHAVLALNAEDDGDRRFIMVSNTEATVHAPDKNLCRDVCAERIRRVIAGYGDVAGLGGDFAYLRARRIATVDATYDLDPTAIWTLLQLRFGRTLTPFDWAQPMQLSPPPPDQPAAPTLAYAPQATAAALSALAALPEPLAIFCPVPGIVREALDRTNLAVEDPASRLLAEFPRNIVGL